MPAIDAEVRVGCQHDRVGNDLSHSDQAGVGEAHRSIIVLSHEVQYRSHVFLKTEGYGNQSPTEEFAKPGPPSGPKKVKRLGQNGFARSPRQFPLSRHGRGPLVMGIAPSEERDEKARVSENDRGQSRSCAGKNRRAR